MSILRVIEPFADLSDLNGRVYNVGDLVDSGDKVVKGRERFFEPALSSVGRKGSGASVETATAAPGEKRSVSPAKKATSAKKES